MRPVPLATATRETILLLHPARQIVPQTIDARGTALRKITPAFVPTIRNAAPPITAPLSGIGGFGKSLFGCAPEAYGNLSPEERALCPKLSGDLAINQPPDPMTPPSHVRNNARWANALAHKQSPLMLPGGFLFPLAALGAIADGSITERSSAFRDPEQWVVEKAPGQFMPQSLDAQEKTYDAWHKDHPLPSGEAVGIHPQAAEGGAAVKP